MDWLFIIYLYPPYISNMRIKIKNIRILIDYRPCKYLPFIFLPFSIYSSGSILITHMVCGIGRRRFESDSIAQKHNLGTSCSFSTTVPNISDETNGHMMSGSRSNRSGISYTKFVHRRWCCCRYFIRGSECCCFPFGSLIIWWFFCWASMPLLYFRATKSPWFYGDSKCKPSE